MTSSIYQTCYDLVVTYMYGAVESGSYHELVAILFSTAATLFVMCMPFLVVWRILKMLGA